MALSRLARKDFIIRKKFKSREYSRSLLKFLLASNLNNRDIIKRLSSQLYLRQSRNQFSYVRAKNRCLVTSRSRYVFSSLGLSRHEFRRKALAGFIPGFYKGSW